MRRLIPWPIRAVVALVWFPIKITIYLFMFWLWWPMRSKAIAYDRYDPYDTVAWKAFSRRIRVKNRKKYGRLTCEECQATGRQFDVHHIKPRATHPGKFLWLPNLMLCCHTCHQDIHGRDF